MPAEALPPNLSASLLHGFRRDAVYWQANFYGKVGYFSHW